ncbi:MAG: hypothetical protein COB04_19600 [Gammaproteobacteria bacterium]|nr:MAG: hypothetical protein COB04_19600 [Gammaproteobacteria bacterium]
MAYTVLEDEYINKLFEGTGFSDSILASTKRQREQIVKTLSNQVNGYWSGHTAYHLVVNGGFLHDDKSGADKRLTALGVAFMEEFKLKGSGSG